MRAAQGIRDLIIHIIGEPDHKGWKNKPNYQGLVWFSGESFNDATGHIDLWNDVHRTYDKNMVLEIIINL